MKAVKSVLSPKNKLFSLADAAANKGIRTWRCAACKQLVHVRAAFGRPVLTHSGTACSSEVGAEYLGPAARTAALLRQNWSLCVSIEDADGNISGSRRVRVERVQAFALPGIEVPLVLVQSYWTAFLVGIVATQEDLQALEKAGKQLDCGAVAVLSESSEWSVLEHNLLSEDALRTVWATPSESLRTDHKRTKFNRISRLNTLPVPVYENRKAEHYDPREPANYRQYLQDILGELCAQRWAKWVRRLVLGQHGSHGRTEWFDAYPLQVPHIWLRFWLIKHSLHFSGRSIDPAALAYQLATVWECEGDTPLTAAVEFVFTELLQDMETQHIVETRDGRFYCVRSLR